MSDDHFFVRWHWADIPTAVDVDSFRLDAFSHVRHPLSIALDGLMKVPRVEIAAVNQCSGNSRGLVQPSAAGAQVFETYALRGRPTFPAAVFDLGRRGRCASASPLVDLMLATKNADNDPRTKVALFFGFHAAYRWRKEESSMVDTLYPATLDPDARIDPAEYERRYAAAARDADAYWREAGKILRRILRKIAGGDIGSLGDTSTLVAEWLG